MNRIIKLFSAVFLVLLAYACSPDEPSLGAVDVNSSELVEGIAFKIEHDATNPNIVHLTSLMPSKYTPLWDHPQGRSQSQTVTLKIPFAGTYDVKFGIQTRGGIVYGEPATFTIDDFYAGFVDDELWTFLSGGVGESKVWIHDNGAYGLATGEMDYADPTTTVEWNNFSPNWSPGKGYTGDDNIWKSTMTFSLAGGANVEVHNESTTGTKDESGTFMVDIDKHTLTFTDANIMHTQGWDFKTTNWGKSLKILTLTENQLRVAVLREVVSGESEWWLIWNFVSKEYADNYVPEDLPDPVPDIDGDANEVLTTTKSKTWVLSSDSPYDWANLNGGLLNNFTGGEATYLATGWAAYDADMIAATKLTFNAAGGNGGTFVFSSYNSDNVEGEYTLDANNDIEFGQPLNAKISESNFGWTSMMWLNTRDVSETDEHKLRVLKTQTDLLGLNVTDMWLGQRSTSKDEYMVYHFVLASGSAEIDPAEAWKKALTGKIFVHNTNYFADWVAKDWTGGWTGENSALFTTPDFDAQGWFFNQAAYDAAKASSISFYKEGGELKANAVDNGVAKNGIVVTIDPDEESLTFSEAPFTYSWLFNNNNAGKGPWLFGKRPGVNLGNIDTKGFHLGFVSGADEITMVHFVKN